MPLNRDKQTRFEVVMPKEARAVLESYAAAQNVTASTIVRVALQEFFERKGIDVDFVSDLKPWSPQNPK